MSTWIGMKSHQSRLLAFVAYGHVLASCSFVLCIIAQSSQSNTCHAIYLFLNCGQGRTSDPRVWAEIEGVSTSNLQNSQNGILKKRQQ